MMRSFYYLLTCCCFAVATTNCLARISLPNACVADIKAIEGALNIFYLVHQRYLRRRKDFWRLLNAPRLSPLTIGSVISSLMISKIRGETPTFIGFRVAATQIR